MKILVVKRDKLGDMLLATPMLRHLRTSLPDAEIHLLASDYNAWVVDGNRDIDHRWIYRRVRTAGRISLTAAVRQIRQDFELRRARFDWVIVANGEDSPRAIARGLSVRGARCVAYCNDAKTYPGLTDPLLVQPAMHESDRMLAMLAPLGIVSPDSVLLPQYSLPAEAASFARTWLEGEKLKAGGYIVLGLGARRAKKQPSTAQVLRWCSHFKTAWDLSTVFIWTPGKSGNGLYPGDDEVAQPVLDAQVPFIHPYRGPIREALGIIWNAKGSIFPDSGLMHFAAASPGGVLGLFAETDVSPSPVQWAPRGSKVSFIEAAKSVEELPDELVFDRLKTVLD